MENISGEGLRKMYKELTRKENWDHKCEICNIPEILHKGVCTRTTGIGKKDYE